MEVDIDGSRDSDWTRGGAPWVRGRLQSLSACYLGNRTSSLPGQAVPCSAASTQICTVALGPLSVKSAKKLLGRFLKVVTPSFTVSWVTTGKGMVILALACLPCRISVASSRETSTRYGGWPADWALTPLALNPSMYWRKPFSASPAITFGSGRLA